MFVAAAQDKCSREIAGFDSFDFTRHRADQWAWVWSEETQMVLAIMFGAGVMTLDNQYTLWAVTNAPAWPEVVGSTPMPSRKFAEVARDLAPIAVTAWKLCTAPVQFPGDRITVDEDMVEWSATGNGWLDGPGPETKDLAGSQEVGKGLVENAQRQVYSQLRLQNILLGHYHSAKAKFLKTLDEKMNDTLDRLYFTMCTTVSWWLPSLEFLRATMTFLVDSVSVYHTGEGGVSAGAGAGAGVVEKRKYPVVLEVGSGFGYGAAMISAAAVAQGLKVGVIATDGFFKKRGLEMPMQPMRFPVVCKDGLTAMADHGDAATVLLMAFPPVDGKWQADVVRQWRERHGGKWLILVDQFFVKMFTAKVPLGRKCRERNTCSPELYTEIHDHWELAREKVPMQSMDPNNSHTETCASYWRVKSS